MRRAGVGGCPGLTAAQPQHLGQFTQFDWVFGGCRWCSGQAAGEGDSGGSEVGHPGVLRAAIEALDGFVFSTAGDAFSAAFHTPGFAVGLDAQRALQAEAWPADTPLRVRMGVHLGTVQERDGDYFGSAATRAARLMGLAHGGQALVSLAVEELVRDDLGEGVGLKGLAIMH